MNWIKNRFFIGRASRKQYWLNFLFLFLLACSVFIAEALLSTAYFFVNSDQTTYATEAVVRQQMPDGNWEPIQTQQQTEITREDRSSSAVMAFMFFGYIFGIFMMILAFQIPFIRRLHDLGHSGWFSLLGFIPVVGPLLWLGLFIYCGFFSGQPGENKYGPSPI